ncbi:ATP-binding protein [Pseudomonas sp. dw_358]|uniref:ATP-binding protein n=1 Tax=Pseudomonas sp. dw_358 TaxID=2720083 RepID=UPI001BD3471A
MTKTETLPLRRETDIVVIRQRVRKAAEEVRLGLVSQTKIITAASEIARNGLIYGGGGECVIEITQREGRSAIRLIIADQGPGIENLDRAMTDGWTSGGGLGLGLSGAKRLVDHFAIDTVPGSGTTIELWKWR